MNESFLMLSRQLFSHHLWQEQRTYHRAEAWVDLIQMAAYRSHKRLIEGKTVEIQRGGLVASVRYLSDRWTWSKTKVCLFLELLEAESMIRREKGQGITVVLLCNFEKYNPKKGHEPDVGRTPRGQRKDEREEGEEQITKKHIAPTQLRWSLQAGWECAGEDVKAEWKVAYPACDIERQLSQMTQWLKSNPAKAKKSNWLKFVTNWLKREQDRGGDMRGTHTNGHHTKPAASSHANAGNANRHTASSY